MNCHSLLGKRCLLLFAASLVLSCSDQSGESGQPGGAGGSHGSAEDAASLDHSLDHGEDATGDDGRAGSADAGMLADGAGGSGAVDARGGSGGAGNSDGAVGTDGNGGTGGQGGADGGPRDPFGSQPDTSEGLTNVSPDLDALLERGALKDACAAWQRDPTNRRMKLLCGKSMFFYEGFGTAGVPKPLVTWLITNFPAEVGAGFEKLGLIADPSSTEKLPLGFAPGKPFGAGNVETEAFTCASCHFGRLPDGRYAVGAANYAFQYGALNLMVSVLPSLALPGGEAGAHDPAALSVIQPLRDRMAQDPAIQLALLGAVLPLLGSTVPTLSQENERHYAQWRAGTMDFFIQPLPFDDGVHTISKIPHLWGLPDEAELRAEGLASANLGATGGTLSLLNFMRGFVLAGGGAPASWPDARFDPIVAYIHSLRSPASTTPSTPGSVEQGRLLFASRGCLGCHDAPRGSGRQLYDYSAIGTDDALMRYTDPNLSGAPCCGIPEVPGDVVTHQLKSPRLVGLWAMQRFLHNGSLDSLEQLLCLDARPSPTEPAFGSGGHAYGCDAPADERRAIIDYLRAH